jgi:hypothetical protein
MTRQRAVCRGSTSRARQRTSRFQLEFLIQYDVVRMDSTSRANLKRTKTLLKFNVLLYGKNNVSRSDGGLATRIGIPAAELE